MPAPTARTSVTGWPPRVRDNAPPVAAESGTQGAPRSGRVGFGAQPRLTS